MSASLALQFAIAKSYLDGDDDQTNIERHEALPDLAVGLALVCNARLLIALGASKNDIQIGGIQLGQTQLGLVGDRCRHCRSDSGEDCP